MPVPRGQCIVCKWRKARFVNGTCEPCGALVDAEGTHDTFGVAKLSPTQQQWHERAAEYNKLIKKRWSQKRIAELWGIPVGKLRSQVYRWKTRGGIKVVPGWGNRITVADFPKATSVTTPRVNEHGGGKWGVSHCECEPCMKRRRYSRMLTNRDYRARLKLKKQQEKNVT